MIAKDKGCLNLLPLTMAGLPIVQRTGGRWERAVYNGLDGNCGISLDSLCDLARYGIVGGLAEISPGKLLLAADTEYKSSGSDIALIARNQRILGRSDMSVFQIEEDTDADRAYRSRYAVISAARAVAQSLKVPFVANEYLSIVCQARSLPAGNYAVSLRKRDPKGFAALWRASITAQLSAQDTLLKERRRLALGLPVNADPTALDLAIETALIAPMVEEYFAQMLSGCSQKIYVFPEGQSYENGTVIPCPVAQFNIDDPPGENIFILGGRILMSLDRRSTVIRSLSVNPFMIPRSVHRLGQQTPLGAGEAMLAALQLGYLHARSGNTDPGVRAV